MTLWCVIFSTSFLVSFAEEFGIPRRTSTQPHQQPAQQVLPNVVRIIAFDPNGQSFGTGSYVGTYGEYGIILTNWHVIAETKEDENLVHVHFPFGFSSFGAIIKSDKTWDLALIVISKPPQSLPTLPISQMPPKPGDPLWIAGFGSGSYRIAGGRCVRYLAPPDKPGVYEIVEVSVSARKGDSGGPILNQKGELAGVLFGSDMIRNTAGSYSEQVNRFLMDTHSKIERLPSRPETCFASIEKNKPLYKLEESRNAVPQDTQSKVPVLQRPDFTGSSSSGFGIRPSSRRYVTPVPNEQPRIQQPAPQQRSGASTTGTPLSSLLPLHRMQPAKFVQVAHLTPLQVASPATENSFPVEYYRLKLFSDQHDQLFTFFLSLNACFALGLTCVAVRILFPERKSSEHGWQP